MNTEPTDLIDKIVHREFYTNSLMKEKALIPCKIVSIRGAMRKGSFGRTMILLNPQTTPFTKDTVEVDLETIK